jgi:hypothetical protein
LVPVTYLKLFNVFKEDDEETKKFYIEIHFLSVTSIKKSFCFIFESYPVHHILWPALDPIPNEPHIPFFAAIGLYH